MMICKTELTKFKNHGAEAKLNTYKEILDKVRKVNTFRTSFDLIVDKVSVHDTEKVIGHTDVETENYRESERYILKYHFSFSEEYHVNDLDFELEDCFIVSIVEEQIISILLKGRKYKTMGRPREKKTSFFYGSMEEGKCGPDTEIG
ncbi:hypothetical protein AVEN_156408-1 [Araneus ventricosus]|uniref:Uncharacterized protein n=1 Tax=Araneus ventricosus TaxID=182803 RepID=A0A4Y2R4T0_ARAVE|nr:hypothetical protein AVEN_156408-1 [Araneus ventricosus]